MGILTLWVHVELGHLSAKSVKWLLGSLLTKLTIVYGQPSVHILGELTLFKQRNFVATFIAGCCYLAGVGPFTPPPYPSSHILGTLGAGPSWSMMDTAEHKHQPHHS